MSVNSLANATLASLATFSLVKKGASSSGLRKRSEGFATGCDIGKMRNDAPLYRYVNNECTKTQILGIKDDNNAIRFTQSDLDDYCNKKDNKSKPFCGGTGGGGGGGGSNTPAAGTPAAGTPAAGTPAAATGTISINVTVGEKTKEVSIESDDTLEKIIGKAMKDDDLSGEAGFLGVGFHLFGLIKNFTLTVDGTEMENPEADETASELSIGAGSTVEFEVDNLILYGLSASCCCCCLAIIGLIVYFMFMQGDGGYY